MMATLRMSLRRIGWKRSVSVRFGDGETIQHTTAGATVQLRPQRGMSVNDCFCLVRFL